MTTIVIYPDNSICVGEKLYATEYGQPYLAKFGLPEIRRTRSEHDSMNAIHLRKNAVHVIAFNQPSNRGGKISAALLRSTKNDARQRRTRESWEAVYAEYCLMKQNKNIGHAEVIMTLARTHSRTASAIRNIVRRFEEKL